MGGATTSGVVCARGAVCGANQPNCGHEFAIIALAASPYDCKAKVVPTPMKHAMRKRARARKAILPSDGRIGPTDEWAIASRPGGATSRGVGKSNEVAVTVVSIGLPALYSGQLAEQGMILWLEEG